MFSQDTDEKYPPLFVNNNGGYPARRGRFPPQAEPLLRRNSCCPRYPSQTFLQRHSGRSRRSHLQRHAFQGLHLFGQSMEIDGNHLQQGVILSVQGFGHGPQGGIHMQQIFTDRHSLLLFRTVPLLRDAQRARPTCVKRTIHQSPQKVNCKLNFCVFMKGI